MHCFDAMVNWVAWREQATRAILVLMEQELGGRSDDKVRIKFLLATYYSLKTVADKLHELQMAVGRNSASPYPIRVMRLLMIQISEDISRVISVVEDHNSVIDAFTQHFTEKFNNTNYFSMDDWTQIDVGFGTDPSVLLHFVFQTALEPWQLGMIFQALTSLDTAAVCILPSLVLVISCCC